MGVVNRFMNFLGLQEEEEIIERETYMEQEDEHGTNLPLQRKHKGNVIGIHSQKNTKMVLSEPRSYEEAQHIADHLRSHRPVVVNLQRVRADQAMRIVDFLSGTVYALSGGIAKIGPNIFLCTPDSIEIQGSITDILDGEGDFKLTR